MKELNDLNILIAVGSRHNQTCSIGSFARAELDALKKCGVKIELLEPNENLEYPNFSAIKNKPDLIIYHAPSLADRKRPWLAITNLFKIKFKYPNAKILNVVHEYTEAPFHWKIRQKMISAISDIVVANTQSDYLNIKRVNKNTLYINLGPTLFDSELQSSLDKDLLFNKICETRKFLSQKFSLSDNLKWLLFSGLLTPGKGCEVLLSLEPKTQDFLLIVMGGFGPKPKDIEYAKNLIQNLQNKFQDKFIFIQEPTDDIYKNFLLGSNLVFLPYENGVSERRSSFLSSISCGANVCTTIGEYSNPLKIEESGVFTIPKNFLVRDLNAVINQALLSEALELRIKNLKYSLKFSWENRVKKYLQAYYKT